MEGAGNLQSGVWPSQWYPGFYYPGQDTYYPISWWPTHYPLIHGQQMTSQVKTECPSPAGQHSYQSWHSPVTSQASPLPEGKTESPAASPAPSQAPCQAADDNSNQGKPPYSYIALISMAIANSPDQMATLREICNYIETRFPYYSTRATWRSSIRHNLTLNDCFVKHRVEGMRAHRWSIDPEFRDMFDNGSLMRRKYRFKEGSVKWHRQRARAARAASRKAVQLEAPTNLVCSQMLPDCVEEPRPALDQSVSNDSFSLPSSEYSSTTEVTYSWPASSSIWSAYAHLADFS